MQVFRRKFRRLLLKGAGKGRAGAAAQHNAHGSQEPARITADGVVDCDELLELHLAVERVIPSAHRTQVIQARKKREAARRERLEEQRRIEKEKEKEDRKRIREEEYARQMRLRHSFAKGDGGRIRNGYFAQRVSNGQSEAIELETMLLTRYPEEIFAAEDQQDWDDWVEFFSRTREADARRKGVVEVEL